MYVLGGGSQKELVGVHPKLVAVVHRAIEVTTQDFAVHDGLRTIPEQREYVRRGVSKTMKSMHMIQADGYGHATDLVPYINGKMRWEWDPIWAIAVAMDKAATELNVRLIWGAVWDKAMMDYGGSAAALMAEVEAYKKRHAGSDFLDGPHYQLA